MLEAVVHIPFFLNDKSSCLRWYAIAIPVVFFNKALLLK